MNIQALVNQAAESYKAGERTEALKFYNQAFEKLSDEAAIFAHAQPETFRDEKTIHGEKVRTILPKLFEETKKHLQQDKTACVILKNMAVIYNELGDRNSAIKALEQSIELTPDGEDNTDAINGLDKLKK